jgi:hypothetical protein
MFTSSLLQGRKEEIAVARAPLLHSLWGLSPFMKISISGWSTSASRKEGSLLLTYTIVNKTDFLDIVLPYL